MYHIHSMEGDNLGGIAELFFTEQDSIALFPYVSDLAMLQPLQLKPGRIWYHLKFTTGTAGYTEEEKLEDNGPLYDHEIQGFRAQDAHLVGLAFHALAHKKLILLVKDQNGVTRLFGNTEDYVLISRKAGSGNAPADRNGSNFTFKGKSSLPAIYYFSPTPDTIDSGSGIGNMPGAGTGAGSSSGSGGTFQPVTIVDGQGKIIATLQSGGTFQITSGFSFGFRILS